jgi:hypothetical protein
MGLVTGIVAAILAFLAVIIAGVVMIVCGVAYGALAVFSALFGVVALFFLTLFDPARK